MEPFKADTFYKIGRLLEQVASGHAATGGVGDEFSVRVMRNESLDDPLSEIDKTSIQLVLIAIAKECAQVGLCRATQIAKDILHQLNLRNGAQLSANWKPQLKPFSNGLTLLPKRMLTSFTTEL